MKKTILFLTAVIFTSSLAACGNTKTIVEKPIPSPTSQETYVEPTAEVPSKNEVEQKSDDLVLLEAYEQKLLEERQLATDSKITYQDTWNSYGEFSGYYDPYLNGTGILSTQIIPCNNSYYLVTSSVKDLIVYVMVYAVCDGNVLELTNEEFQYKLGTCEDYVQIAYKQVDDKLTLYLTTTGFVTVMEGGYLIQYAGIYEIKDNTASVLLDNEKDFLGNYDFETFLPNTVQLYHDFLAEHNTDFIYSSANEQIETFPFVLDLSETEPGLTMLSRLYFYPNLSVGLTGFCTDYSQE